MPTDFLHWALLAFILLVIAFVAIAWAMDRAERRRRRERAWGELRRVNQ